MVEINIKCFKGNRGLDVYAAFGTNIQAKISCYNEKDIISLRVLSSEIESLVVWCKSTDVSEEHIAFIFNLTGLHGVVLQEIEFFIGIAVRTSDSANYILTLEVVRWDLKGI
jgi:hypothetical protein